MIQRKNQTANLITIFLSTLPVLLSIYFFIKTSPEKISPQTYTIFIGILVIFTAGIILYHFYSRWEEISRTSKRNSKIIDDIKKDIKIQTLFSNMEKRLSILEALSKSKRGMIDPRIIFVLIMAFLFYLFLKSINFFG